MFHKAKNVLELIKKIKNYEQRFDKIEQSLGRIEARQNTLRVFEQLSDYEFKVSSQWGEDGIIQYLVNKVAIKNKIFVEFGVENYTESNTRFLLQNNNWSGLVIDGSTVHVEYIKRDPIYWQHNLKAECAFITKENINKIITKNGIKGDIGILSVDIDGNDYWVWEAIDCVSPSIVICEYNSHFGDTAKVSVPYDSGFVRNNKHFSNIYYGASISALHYLARKKGYSLIGSNSVGNNIFFVKDKLLEDLKPLEPKDSYRRSTFREARDKNGQLRYTSIEDNLELISDLPLLNVESNEVGLVKDLL